MFGLSPTASYPIGIDAGAQALRVLQFKRGSTGLALQAACRFEFESSGASQAAPFAGALRQAMESHPFSGRRAVLSLPVSAVHSKSVRLPQMPDSDLSQALQWEAKDRFGFEVGEGQAVAGGDSKIATGQLVWFRAGEVRRGTEVKDELLLFAVNGETLNTYIQAMSEAGLQLAAIDIAPCATFRGIRRAMPIIGTGSRAILDLGHQGSQFFIIRDGGLVFYKYIDIGSKSINDAISAKLGISATEAMQMRARIGPADRDAQQDVAPLQQALRDAMRSPLEELARELDMCMRYFVVTFRDTRPEIIALAGRQSGCPQIRELLTTALGLQIEEAQALRGIQQLGEAARPDRSGEWALAAGLSLYPIDGVERMEAAA